MSRQAYLDDQEFEAVFGMSREDWARQAKWRRDDQKKKVGLF